MLLGFEFKHRLGAVTSAIGTFCGIGCMVGPTLGGLLYGIGDTFVPAFSLPFIFLAVMELGLAFFCLFYFTEFQRQEEEKDQKKEKKSVLIPSRVLTLVAIGLSGTVVATLDPTLAFRLGEEPFNYSSSMIGVVFMISSISYTATSIPVGWAIDQLPYDSLCTAQINANTFRRSVFSY